MLEKNDYKRSLEDEIDWKIIDQLHSATGTFTTTSLELKKLYFVLIGIAVPSLIKLAGDKLDASLFVSLYIITLLFWSLDSYTYYYQEKLREKMDLLFIKIKTRNGKGIIIPNPERETFTIEITRTSKRRFWRSLSNPSLTIYMVLILVNTITFLLFQKGVIK